MDKEKELWVWVTVQDADCCDSCKPRHDQIKSLVDWRKLGLPKSEQLACGSACRCSVMAVDPADTEPDLEDSLRLTDDRVAKVEDQARIEAERLRIDKERREKKGS